MKFFIGDIALLEDPRLSATDLKVYFTLVSYMNRDTGKCFPRMATIGTKINLSRNTIAKSIAKLVKLGFMTKKRLPSTNEYTLNKHSDFLANTLLFKRYIKNDTPDVSKTIHINRTTTNYLNNNKKYSYNNYDRQQSISDTPLGKLSNKILKYNNKDLLFYQSEGVLDFYKDSEGNTFTRNRVNNEIKCEGSLKKKLKIVA